MIRLLPSDPVRRGRVKLLLLAGFFALPVLGSWLAYVFEWTPGTAGNYGELLAPRSLPQTPMIDAEGRTLTFSDLRGRWILLSFDAAACDAYCERKLYFLRQVRKAQGENMHRIERVWVLTDGRTPTPELTAAIAGTHVVRAPAALSSAFPAARRVEDHVYLVDPLGNLMMRFPREPDPSRMVKDVKRLLKYSRIG